MPHSSDSDEFFDAEEITPSKINTYVLLPFNMTPEVFANLYLFC